MAEFRHIVRIANTDLKGELPLLMALQKIKGVSFMMANAFCVITKIDPRKKTGELDTKEEEALNKIVFEPEDKIPPWMLNRRKDPESGINHHLLGGDIKFTVENDIKLQRKIKSYKGVRHASRLPVRGQRTKSNFRPNKGKVAVKTRRTTVRK